tara:strand:- start:1113 stop:1613 length:501 start_codon:yes stop_codon:yes gene_type:complete
VSRHWQVLPHEMTNSISSPFSYTNDELQLIEERFDNHADWNTACFDRVKTAIRNDLRPKQYSVCCYCKWELGQDIKKVDIENIIPKSTYSAYTFHPLNLSLSCPSCNTSKGNKPVLVSDITEYPIDGTSVKIVHPHFDDYNDHIEMYKDAIYEGYSVKGSETIKIM